jgi:hypothetical protein
MRAADVEPTGRDFAANPLQKQQNGDGRDRGWGARPPANSLQKQVEQVPGRGDGEKCVLAANSLHKQRKRRIGRPLPRCYNSRAARTGKG